MMDVAAYHHLIIEPAKPTLLVCETIDFVKESFL